MNSPEQRDAIPPLQPDSSTERTTMPIFQVRFGCGAHSLRLSDWHELMAQDLDSFFQSSDPTQRSTFFMEDALGTQRFQDTIRKAYRAYGKYTTAWGYANLHLRPADGFPPADSVDARYSQVVASQVPVLADGLRFYNKVFGTLDEIVERKGITIDFALEIRRDPKERTQIEQTATFMKTHGRPNSAEEFRQYVLQAWYMRRVRDQKIVEDLRDIYKKAFKQKQPTKVYVSLGEDHAAISNLMTAKLGKSPSYEVTLIRQPLYPQYEESSSNVVMERAFGLMDTRTPFSPQQWQEMYAEMVGAKYD